MPILVTILMALIKAFLRQKNSSFSRLFLVLRRVAPTFRSPSMALLILYAQRMPRTGLLWSASAFGVDSLRCEG